ncbi:MULTISPECIES: hypothetical protein [unclassified Bradyrhizobium]|uniref:hypothetical protein n=1 Tax=unclassified Bradyrhizobium TaxID=2631580 RepID=UPI001FDA3020|nr:MULTISPECIES: hypothetical protein [unclassified Bradyrhizobium]
MAAFFLEQGYAAAPGKGNGFASAQYVESNMHRSTATALMAQAFAFPVERRQCSIISHPCLCR